MDRSRAGYIEGFVSIVVNILLFGIKLWAGIVTGSIALTADAWHTLSDSLSSVVVVAGVRLSSRKPDREHPFGHGRWEQIAALVIAFILGVIAWDFMKESVIRFTGRESVQFGTLAIVATVVSIVVKEALARFAFYIGKLTDNVTVKADGWHHRSDALSSVVVLAGIFVSDYFWWVDSLLGAIISLMLFYATYKIAREAIDKLLGEKPSPELIRDITDLIEKNYGDNIQPHQYHIQNYVAHQELTYHIKLDNHINIK
jgi:cation diffusion facilitator family transporter